MTSSEADTPHTSVAIVARNARNNLLATLEGCNYLSPPLVSIQGKELQYSFLIGPGEYANGEYQVWPPSLEARYLVQNGGFQSLIAIHPKDFLLKLDPQKSLGKGVSPSDRLQTEFLTKELKMFAACDVLVQKLLAAQGYESELNAYSDLLVQYAGVALKPIFDSYFKALLGRELSKS